MAQWLPRLRPYEGRDKELEFHLFYAVTHRIYTLDRYGERRIAPSLLPDELLFLRRTLDEAVADRDSEMVGEALDCLKAPALPTIRKFAAAMTYFMASQRRDGTWAGDAGDLYTEIHSAWTGIDGLRDDRCRGVVSRLPGGLGRRAPIKPLSPVGVSAIFAKSLRSVAFLHG